MEKTEERESDRIMDRTCFDRTRRLPSHHQHNTFCFVRAHDRNVFLVKNFNTQNFEINEVRMKSRGQQVVDFSVPEKEVSLTN